MARIQDITVGHPGRRHAGVANSPAIAVFTRCTVPLPQCTIRVNGRQDDIRGRQMLLMASSPSGSPWV